MTKAKSITMVYLPLLIFSFVFFVLGVDFFYVLSSKIILNLVKVEFISVLCIFFIV